MPEIPTSSITNVYKEIRAEKDKTPNKVGFVEPKEIKEIIRRNNFQEIGMGSECVVVAVSEEKRKFWPNLLNRREAKTPPKKDIVVAFDYQDKRELGIKSIVDPEEAKRRFYTHRILSTLFPHNFPHFYAYYASQENGDISGSVRQRVHKKEGWLPSKVRYPFANVTKAFEALGWDRLIMFDTSTENFLVGKDGGEYYVDKAMIYYDLIDKKLWQTETLLKYMKDNFFSETDQHIVMGSITRIQELQEQKRKMRASQQKVA